MLLKYILLSGFLVSSIALQGQYDKCLYHSMWPLLEVEARSNSDYKISFKCSVDTIYEVKLEVLDSDVAVDKKEVEALLIGLQRVPYSDIKFCLQEGVFEQSIVLILSTRTEVPAHGESNIPKYIEDKERKAARLKGAKFLNLGAIFHHTSE